MGWLKCWLSNSLEADEDRSRAEEQRFTWNGSCELNVARGTAHSHFGTIRRFLDGTEFERWPLAIISRSECSGADRDSKLSSSRIRCSSSMAICGRNSSTSSLWHGESFKSEAEASFSELTALVITGLGLRPRASCPPFWKALSCCTCWKMFSRLSCCPETWALGWCCCCLLWCKCFVTCSLIGGRILVGFEALRWGTWRWWDGDEEEGLRLMGWICFKCRPWTWNSESRVFFVKHS